MVESSRTTKELYTYKKTVSGTSNVVKGAVIGGVLAGGVGSVVGAVAGTTKPTQKEVTTTINNIIEKRNPYMLFFSPANDESMLKDKNLFALEFNKMYIKMQNGEIDDMYISHIDSYVSVYSTNGLSNYDIFEKWLEKMSNTKEVEIIGCKKVRINSTNKFEYKKL